MRPKVAWIVLGLQYGDEGKGSIVDFLAREERSRVIVRYNGGAQAGHRVVLPDGRAHVFAQFGSGMFSPNILTHLSRFMLLEPMGMMAEEAHLRHLNVNDAFSRTSIEEETPIITPFHIATNRLMERARGGNRNGSCGLGVGETVEDVRELGSNALYAGDLKNVSTLRAKLENIRERKRFKTKDIDPAVFESEVGAMNHACIEDRKTIEWCVEEYQTFLKRAHVVSHEHLKYVLQDETVIFEGAQGVLLDERYGWYPHITKTDTTCRNALTLLRRSGFTGFIKKVGVVRGYATRHGVGPFVTENASLTRLLPDAHNGEHAWQGSFRVGYFDLVAARYALNVVGGVHELAITNLDRLINIPDLKVCIGYYIGDIPHIKVSDTLFFSGGKIAFDVKIDENPYNPTHQLMRTYAMRHSKPLYDVCGFVKNKADALQYGMALGRFLRSSPSIFSFGETHEDKITF